MQHRAADFARGSDLKSDSDLRTGANFESGFVSFGGNGNVFFGNCFGAAFFCRNRQDVAVRWRPVVAIY